MKSSNTTTSRETIKRLVALVRDADRINAYKWHFAQAPRDRQARRATADALTHTGNAWTDAGHQWTANLVVSFGDMADQRWHIVADYRRDGRKTNLTAVRNSLTRMIAAADEIQD